MPAARDAWYRLLFERSSDGLLLARADGSVLAANPAACVMLGMTEAALCGPAAADEIAARNPALRAALEPGPGSGPRGAVAVVRGDGSSVFVRLSCERFVDGGEALTSVAMRDVTAAQQAADALRESELRYRTAFVTSPDSITITDLADGRYLDINEGFTQVFGWTREQVLGRTSAELGIWQHPEDRAIFIARAAAAGEVLNCEARFLTRLREPVVALVSSRVITLAGRRCLLTVARDVTDRNRAEIELDQYRHRLEEIVERRTRDLAAALDAAQAATLAKSGFLANLSHEIRTPMNAIVGFAHLLQDTPLSAPQRDHLDRICGASEHLRVVISDVLELSKIESGTLELESVDFRPGPLLDSVAALIGEQARAKGLAIEQAVGPLPDWLRGDPTRLRQAILNLAGNAVKFTEHGKVTLRAATLRDDGARVLLRIEVEDTGIGIAPEATEHLFEAFHQVDASTTRTHGGTGLGLAITRRLAELMGGETGVDSVAGVGSRFWFTAWCEHGQPVADDTARGARAAAASLRRLHAGRHVLVAEDNPVNQELIRLLLAEAGLVVDVAGDGREAVAMALLGCDLILMDMQMPVMDGVEATRAIRQLPGHEKTPIIAVTANAFAEDLRRCLDAGMDEVLTKPFDPEKLYHLLSKWLPPPA